MKELTKREHIAAMCLQGLLSTITIGRDEYIEHMCKTAVKCADALIRHLDTTNADRHSEDHS